MNRWLAAVIAASYLSVPHDGFAQFTSSGAVLISAPLAGQSLTGNSQDPAVSVNSDIVACSSFSENLVSGALDTNKAGDAFMSAAGKELEIVSRRARSVGEKEPVPSANGESVAPSVSPRLQDGGFGVAFQSKAVDVVSDYINPDPTNGNPFQVYLRVYPSNKNILISRSIDQGTTGVKGGQGRSYSPVVSVIPGAIPKYKIAFLSEANDLANSAGTSAAPYLATVTMEKGVEKVVIEALPEPPDAPCADIAMSGDGRIVAFGSFASNLVSAANGSYLQVFQWIPEPLAGETELSLISTTAAGQAGSGNSGGPSLSFKGDVRTFITRARNLVAAASSDIGVVALSRVGSPTISQVNTYSNGSPSGFSAETARLSPSGLYVAFADQSLLSGVPPARHDFKQVYLKELTTGQLTVVSATKDGAVGTGGDSGDLANPDDPSSGAPALGGSGFNSSSLIVAFNSRATNLSSQLNDRRGVFRTSLTAPPPTLTDGLKLSAPPDVQVRGKKAIIKLQKFRLGGTSSGASALASNVTYRVTTRSAGTNYRTITTTTRNQVTMANLSPGRYTVSYRVTGGKGSGRASSTTSPTTSFTIK